MQWKNRWNKNPHWLRRQRNLHGPEFRLKTLISDKKIGTTPCCIQRGWNPEQKGDHYPLHRTQRHLWHTHSKDPIPDLWTRKTTLDLRFSLARNGKPNHRLEEGNTRMETNSTKIQIPRKTHSYNWNYRPNLICLSILLCQQERWNFLTMSGLSVPKRENDQKRLSTPQHSRTHGSTPWG